MKRIGLLFCAVSLGLAACGGGGDGGGATPPAPAPVPVPAPPPPGASATLAVTVIDNLGRPVAGASVVSAAITVTSDTAGRTTLPVATGSEQVIRVARDGFAEQVKVVNIANGTAAAALQAMLIAREAPQTIAAIESGGSVTGKDGVKVTLPAGALVTSGGQAVTGAVQFNLTPVDVTQLDVGAFPGVFEGTPAGGIRSPIVSFGTAELLPQQGGQVLNLAPGKTAEIELPIYERKHQNGTDVKVGDRIALWTLDTASGLWKQEGEGTVVVSPASPGGLALRATISHFSWWNCDAVSGRGSVNLTVNTPGTTLPAGTTAAVEGRTVAGTGPTSVATITVPLGTATQLTVAAESTTRISARIETGNQVCTGSVDVSAPADTTVTAVLDAACITVPVPRIVRPGVFSLTTSSSDLSIQVLVDGPRPDTVEVFVDSTRIASFDAAIQVQPFYTAFWNSTTFAEGLHFVRARATRQGVSRDSAQIGIVVDRTPPQLHTLTPSAGTEVSQTPSFTLTFTEPVNPLPFALGDAVRLALTPVNGSAPVEVPSTATLSADGRTLTVQTQGALPLGVVSLTWGGLKDAAGNLITGTVSATFGVDRSTPIVAQAAEFIDFGHPIAITAGGQLIAAWFESDNNLRVGLHDGTAFTLFGQAADNPVATTIGRARFDMVLDASDRPLIALSQLDAGVNTIVVRRFDGTAWQNVGPAFTGFTAQDRAPLRLRIDAAGRPVLAFMRNSLAQVFRFDAASNTWTSLGAPTSIIGGALDLRFDVALLPNGDPVAVLVQGIPASNATVLKAARHNGTTWVALGGVLDSTSNATVAIGQPYIEGGTAGPWLHYVKTGGVLRLLRFDGTAWEVHDVPRPAGAISLQNPNALKLMGDTPVIAFNDFTLGTFVTRFVNGSFEAPYSTGFRASQLSLAIRNAAAGNTVFIGTQPFTGLLQVERVLFP